VAPQYIAEDLLRAEGFTDVQYVKTSAGVGTYREIAAGNVYISMAFVAPFIIQVDAGVPIVLLGGVHVGCFELFGTERIRTVRDLKGKTVAVPELGSAHHVFLASMASYVGVNPGGHPVRRAPGLAARAALADKKVDAFTAFPPAARARANRPVVVNSALDRPWSLLLPPSPRTASSCANTVATLRAARSSGGQRARAGARPPPAGADRGYDYDYALQTMRSAPRQMAVRPLSDMTFILRLHEWDRSSRASCEDPRSGH
jgi:NitT/TauT family transport system substrate-binding protein